MRTKIKFCGFTRPVDVRAAVAAGADYIGFNFFEPSPRSASPEAVRAMSEEVSEGVTKVALVVNASDAELDEIVEVARPDMIQLHGAETTARVAEVKARYGLPVMKALAVAAPADVAKIAEYGAVADRLLIDAKPPKDAPLPGGNGIPFDWSLIADVAWPCPWMLAGGLTAQNVAEAVELTHATTVDLASGVESAPGLKDPARMVAFVEALRA
ncbi:MAG: phosphoribosylanthranilate isomerase [Pseudomonadota bacterium]